MGEPTTMCAEVKGLSAVHALQSVLNAPPRREEPVINEGILVDSCEDITFTALPETPGHQGMTERLTGATQCLLRLDNEAEKLDRLVALLNDLYFRQMVLFTRDIEGAMSLDNYLNVEEYPSIAAHSSSSDPSKEFHARVQRFADFEKRILVVDGSFSSSFNAGNRVDV